MVEVIVIESVLLAGVHLSAFSLLHIQGKSSLSLTLFDRLEIVELDTCGCMARMPIFKQRSYFLSDLGYLLLWRFDLTNEDILQQASIIQSIKAHCL